MIELKLFYLNSIGYNNNCHSLFSFPYLRKSGLIYTRHIFTYLFSLSITLLENEEAALEFEVYVM